MDTTTSVAGTSGQYNNTEAESAAIETSVNQNIHQNCTQNLTDNTFILGDTVSNRRAPSSVSTQRFSEPNIAITEAGQDEDKIFHLIQSLNSSVNELEDDVLLHDKVCVLVSNLLNLPHDMRGFGLQKILNTCNKYLK